MTAEPSQILDIHKILLAKRGIKVETALAAGMRSAGPAEAKEILGFNPGTSGLLIPYVHPNTGKVRTYRYRPDEPLIINGRPAKYLTPRGVGNMLYFPLDVAPRLKDSVELIVITEGEFKTLAAAQTGFLCIGLTGVWGFRARGENGESDTIPDFDLLDARGRAVSIIFDSDVALNAKVRRARQVLAKELYRRGARVVHGIDLPAEDGTKVGLDDFLARNSVEALYELDAFELPPTDVAPPAEPISTFLIGEDEPLEWGIENIRPVGTSGWIIAAPKVAKSWIMLEEAYCMATGQSVFGQFKVPQQRKVLIVEEEDPRRRVRRRLKRLMYWHGGQVPSDEYLRIALKKGVRLDVDSWREALEFDVKAFRPDFVYLDVFSRLHAADMNDNRAMAEIVAYFDSLNRDFGTGFVILHHTRKNGRDGDSHDEILGSRVLSGFAEASLFLSRTKEKGVIKCEVRLKDEPEDGSFVPEFTIRLTDTEDNKGTGFEYVGVTEERRRDSEMRARALNALEPAEEWRTAKEVAEMMKVSLPTAREILNVLFDYGLIEKDDSDKTHKYRKVPKSNV